jgi:hypothetical protein
MLNTRRYVGVTLWGRSEWKRSAADSSKPRHKLLASGSAHEHIDERLRIVPRALWDRVKARQAQQSHSMGALERRVEATCLGSGVGVSPPVRPTTDQ